MSVDQLSQWVGHSPEGAFADDKAFQVSISLSTEPLEILPTQVLVPASSSPVLATMQGAEDLLRIFVLCDSLVASIPKKHDISREHEMFFSYSLLMS